LVLNDSDSLNDSLVLIDSDSLCDSLALNDSDSLNDSLALIDSDSLIDSESSSFSIIIDASLPLFARISRFIKPLPTADVNLYSCLSGWSDPGNIPFSVN